MMARSLIDLRYVSNQTNSEGLAAQISIGDSSFRFSFRIDLTQRAGIFCDSISGIDGAQTKNSFFDIRENVSLAVPPLGFEVTSKRRCPFISMTNIVSVTLRCTLLSILKYYLLP